MSGNPLEQFAVTPLIEIPVERIGGMGLSFTQSSLYMVLAVLGIYLFFTLSMRKHALVPSRWQSMAELCYEFISGMLRENVGSEGRRFFPFIFSLFMFILFCNLLGMTPYGFTVTSHIAVTFALAIFIFLGVTLVGIAIHGLHFFSYFLPKGTPWWLAPLMIIIELFAYLARPISLSIRLAANMIAGHTILKVIAGFVVSLGSLGGVMYLGSASSFAFILVLTGFEIFVAILQAYIFTILVTVYLHDAIHLH